MPRGLPFSVDTWTPSSKKKRHHFLTHAHKDHSSGISTHSAYPIYSTHLTKTLILQQYPQVCLHFSFSFFLVKFDWAFNFGSILQLDDSLFVGIEVGQSMVVDDPDGRFGVTAFDANHCPGIWIFFLIRLFIGFFFKIEFRLFILLFCLYGFMEAGILCYCCVTFMFDWFCMCGLA